tara:strand:- start:435423 stop:436664 length:1242 start_codon:yes stop_codon:yes gene_type:complete
MAVRVILLGVLGLIGGAVANHVIYRWCYFPRPISPWATPDGKAPPRRASDRIPVVGWFGLARESSIHGRGFWLRPILIEIGLAVALPALYWFETQTGGLMPLAFRGAFIPTFEPWGTRIFFGHAILLLLMTAATFIDFDEQTIPDAITIPGTILALALASVSTMGFMPADIVMPNGAAGLTPTTFDLPWLKPIAQWTTSKGLVAGGLIWTAWCFALADRRLILRKGLAKAVEFFLAGLFRYPTWKLLVAIWCTGLGLISVVWWWGGTHWQGLFSGLVGLAVGGGIVWAIRIVASGAMRVEAMGFGDVTLMAMIGAFIGWQGAVAAFFLSPFAAIAIIVVQYIVTRNPRVPFGPYLCAGTVLTILYWDRVYNEAIAPNFAVLGNFVLWMCLALLGLMGGLLFVWRLIKEAIFTD